MRAVDIIRAKRDGGELPPEHLDAFVAAAATGGWPDYQLSALLMAVVLRGMTAAETAHLTRAMAASGKRLDLSDVPGPKVGKHSTGGVGDKTTLVAGPLAAACGVVVPKMSGRGLGHSGGTLDKLESIPGFRVHLTEDEFKAALREVGLALAGPTADLAPADKSLYRLRDVTATVESVPLLTSSILSKKLAEGADGVVLDVKCGRGAFMPTREGARELADALVRNGTASGLKVAVLVTAMDAPLGRAVGNSLEVVEAVETLKGSGPADLAELCLRLATDMVVLAGLGSRDEAAAKVRRALDSGAALEVFRRCVERQGGDPKALDDPARLPTAPRTMDVVAPRDGFVADMDAGAVGHAAVVLGGGRGRHDDEIDPGVGVVCRAKPGDPVRAGQPVYEVVHRGFGRLLGALPVLEASFTVADAPPPTTPVVLEEVV
ncbi:MAG: thymidine phosphorylase [Gemmataceae bacterium]|nr:thymidine phosphorylase [Gemmataceae bacterium]